MAYATAANLPIVREGFSALPCEPSPGGIKRGWWGWWSILPTTPQDLCLEQGEFALQNDRGHRLIARATGRTRWFGTWLAATLEVFEVDTVVEMVGDLPVIVGRRGERLHGTWRTSRDAFREPLPA